MDHESGEARVATAEEGLDEPRCVVYVRFEQESESMGALEKRKMTNKVMKLGAIYSVCASSLLRVVGKKGFRF